jgi:hypothetical protein
MAERGTMDTPNTPIHDRSFSCIGTGTSTKSDGAKLVLCFQTSPLSEVMRSCKCFPHVSKMPTLSHKQGEQCYYKERYYLEHYT